MGTIVWLLITTALGATIGHYGFNAVGIGALIGLVVGVFLRLLVASGAPGEAGDFVGDVADGIGDAFD